MILDLFGQLDADYISISTLLSSIGESTRLSNTRNIHVFSVSGVKIGIMNLSLSLGRSTYLVKERAKTELKTMELLNDSFY